MKHLLQYFTELSLHPKNAEELKGLILQLAVQGKLTAKWREENPEVEPASVLLERIKEEKTQLVKEKKIRKEKPLPEITDDEIPFDLPVNWSWCRLGDLGFTQTGSTPPKKNPENYGDFISFLGPADISNSWIRYPVEGLSERGIKIGRLIPKYSLMMVCIGGSIGKCNITQKDVSCNQQINTLTPIIGPAGYIKVICQSSNFQREVLDRSTGSATPIINKGKWERIIVPAAPLEEQKAIVAVVNQLFTEVEQLENLTKERIQLKEDFVTSALHQLHTGDTATEWTFLQQHFPTFFTEESKIKKLRESILQLAVQGKLTRHWRAENPEVEPASVLLERIQEEKAQLVAAKKIRKEKPLPEITEEELPYELPEGWVWCRLGELIRFMAYGTSQKTNDIHTNVPVLRMGNITPDGKLHFNNLKYIPSDHKDLPKLYLEYGDLVFNRTNSYALVGKTGVYKGRDHEFTLASYLIKVSLFVEYINSDYVNNYIVSPVCRQTQIEPQITAQTNQANFSGSKLRNVLIPLASTEEQKAIVKKVNTLLALCDQLEQAIQSSKATQEDWMKSSLREVFEVEVATTQ